MRNLVAAALFAMGAGAMTTGAYAQDTAPDGPGPNLVLEIGGSVQGEVVIDLLPDVAPKAAERLEELAEKGEYNDVVFHRVIDGFMAQTGDVQFGKRGSSQISMAGMGGSTEPDLPAEFSNRKFVRGIVGMARSQNPDSANSQFFIMFADAPHLNGQYTVVGHVVKGMDIVDQIKKGDSAKNGLVDEPDYIVSAKVEK
ncbi:peptidylprolyl isomerase [Thioclava sp. 'Guangxiensis']|uniref:peptidylprolyl isomerase n=2 Tax=Thioclava TaxID=285107 RepID=UPI003877A9E9